MTKNSKDIDQLEIDLDLLFNKILYKYFLCFIKQNINNIIFKFLRYNDNIVSRRSFLIPKLVSWNYWSNMEINYSQVYEYNMIYFGQNREQLIKDLLHRLSEVNFDKIKESYNCKIVPAIESDLRSGERISKNFLVRENNNIITVSFMLLVNHVQTLYRMPVQFIKLKFLDKKIPNEIQTLNYNSQTIFISNQDVFLETLVEADNLSEVVSTLLFMKTLDTEHIDYKVRQQIVPNVRAQNINDIITYQNFKEHSLDEILKKLEKT